MQNALEKAMVQLVREYRFYAKVLLRMKKVATTELPTLAVSVENGITLLYNPYFFQHYSIEAQVDFLRHEINHLGLHHFERAELLGILKKDRRGTKATPEDILKRMTEATTWNVAADIAINQALPNLPKKLTMFDKEGNPILNDKGNVTEFEGCHVEQLDDYIPNVKRNMPWEYYYFLMKKHGTPKGVSLLDDHGGFGSQGDPLNDEITKELIKKIFNEAAQECGGREAGNIPGEMKEILERMNNKPKDWRDDLNSFVARNFNVKIETTKRKKNRRYGWQYPGVRYEPKLVLPVAIDISGSVSNEELQQFMAEIDAIHQLGIKVIIIQCDVDIRHVEEYDPNAKIKIHGRGGTKFKPVFNLLNSNEFTDEYGEVDGLIYLTDGENWGEDIEEPEYPVLWALLPNHKVKYDWGETTVVEVKKVS